MAGDMLLAVENLSIALPGGADRAHAVADVSFTVGSNEIVCLVGESGSGKSMTAHAILSLLPERVAISSGSLRFKGRDIAGLDEPAMRALRGGEISMIFQEPMSALNPLDAHRRPDRRGHRDPGVTARAAPRGRPRPRSSGARYLGRAAGARTTIVRAYPLPALGRPAPARR
jgi:peptide/nickel transport system ATP-binding protein